VLRAGGDHPGAGAQPCAGPCDEDRAQAAGKDQMIVMNMCGRGDKDIFTVAKHLGFDMKV
jgi:tryptophan synthase beta subunit